MLIETFGKHRYAFGLDWLVQTENLVADLTAAQVLPSDEPVYAVTVGAETKKSLRKGKTKKNESNSASLGAVYGYFVTVDSVSGVIPAAAAIARKGDGIYLAQLTGGMWWFVAIHNHVPIAHTDRLGAIDEILDQVGSLRDGLGLEVFTATQTEELLDTSPLDLDAAMRAGAKAPALRRVSSGSSVLVPVVLVVGFLVIAFFGYRFIFPPKPKLTPEQQQELARQTYVQSVQDVLKTYPEGSEWIATAYQKASKILPPFIDGWSLEGVQCTPGSCLAMYVTEQGEPFAYSPLQSRFGKSVTVLPDGHSAQVMIPAEAPAITINEGYLRSLRPETLPLLDWVGAVPLDMGGSKVDGQILLRHLDQELGGNAAAMPPLTFEQISVKSDSYLDNVSVNLLLRMGSKGGFVPVQAAWSYGNGHIPSAWRMTWERIHG